MFSRVLVYSVNDVLILKQLRTSKPIDKCSCNQFLSKFNFSFEASTISLKDSLFIEEMLTGKNSEYLKDP